MTTGLKTDLGKYTNHLFNTAFFYQSYRQFKKFIIYSKCLDSKSLANSADPDKTAHLDQTSKGAV